jgi:biopolymer transport protein ExbD
MRITNSPRRRPTVNVTSLIDVMFLLLTFFLVTTQFMDQSALKVELPQMSHSEKVAHEKRFVLNAAADGAMMLDGEPVTFEILREKLAISASKIDQGGGLVLRADRRLPYGEVMRILDLVRGAGIRRISNATSENSK